MYNTSSFYINSQFKTNRISTKRPSSSWGKVKFFFISSTAGRGMCFGDTSSRSLHLRMRVSQCIGCHKVCQIECIECHFLYSVPVVMQCINVMKYQYFKVSILWCFNFQIQLIFSSFENILMDEVQWVQLIARSRVKSQGGTKFPRVVHLVRKSTSHPEISCRRQIILKILWLNRKKGQFWG